MDDSHKSWGATYVNKLLPGRNCTLVLLLEQAGGEIGRDALTSSIRLLGGSQ